MSTAGSGGAAGQSPSCGDTRTDPANCGMCGHACSANGALVACMAGTCVRSCNGERDDCNHDLESGARGDGCETPITGDVEHCGHCDVRCLEPVNGTRACESKQCVQYTSRLGAADPGANALHGNPDGGAAYDLRCHADEALVGIDAAADAYLLYGYAVRCAKLGLRGTPGAQSFSLGETRTSTLVGNMTTGMPPFSTLQCPADMVVTAVSGALWHYPSSTGPLEPLSVKRLTLHCSQLGVDAAGSSTSTEAGTLTVGSDADVASTFDDSCGPSRIVVGFTGRSGAYLDAIQTHCASLSVTRSSAP